MPSCFLSYSKTESPRQRFEMLAGTGGSVEPLVSAALGRGGDEVAAKMVVALSFDEVDELRIRSEAQVLHDRARRHGVPELVETFCGSGRNYLGQNGHVVVFELGEAVDRVFDREHVQCSEVEGSSQKLLQFLGRSRTVVHALPRAKGTQVDGEQRGCHGDTVLFTKTELPVTGYHTLGDTLQVGNVAGSELLAVLHDCQQMQLETLRDAATEDLYNLRNGQHVHDPGDEDLGVGEDGLCEVVLLRGVGGHDSP